MNTAWFEHIVKEHNAKATRNWPLTKFSKMFFVNVKAPNETIHFSRLYTYAMEVLVWGIYHVGFSPGGGVGTDREEAHEGWDGDDSIYVLESVVGLRAYIS